MTEETPAAPKKKIRWKRILGFLLFVVLAGAVGYGLSWLNARTYYLVVEAAQVRVGKGRMLPVGYDPFVPLDPALRKAYESFPLPGGLAIERGEQKLDDRVELDQALFRVLQQAATHSLAREDARTPKLMAIYLDRLRSLPGTNAAQRAEVEQLAKQALFVEAKGNLEAGIGALSKAAEQFEASAKTQDAARSASARTHLERIQRALSALSDKAPAKPAPVMVPPPAAPAAVTTTTSSASR